MNAYYLIITHTTIVNKMVFPEANSQNLYYLFVLFIKLQVSMRQRDDTVWLNNKEATCN